MVRATDALRNYPNKRPHAARLLRSWVRFPPGAWIFVCCECRVLSGRGLCDELITRPEESYRLWYVVVCDLETSRIGAPYIYIYIYIYNISSLRVNQTWIFSTYFPKILEYQFHENPSSGSRVVYMRTDGETDRQTKRHDETNSHFSQCCERA